MNRNAFFTTIEKTETIDGHFIYEITIRPCECERRTSSDALSFLSSFYAFSQPFEMISFHGRDTAGFDAWSMEFGDDANDISGAFSFPDYPLIAARMTWLDGDYETAIEILVLDE